MHSQRGMGDCESATAVDILHVRYRRYRRLLLESQQPPSLLSYMPLNLHRWRCYWFGKTTYEPRCIARGQAPIVIVARKFSPKARALDDSDWRSWRLAYCHGSWCKRRGHRRVHSYSLRRTRMHGGSDSSHPEDGSSFGASPHDHAGSAITPSSMPADVLSQFVPGSDISVTQALAQCPPMSRDAQPLYFENTMPTLVADAPNALLAPAGSADLTRELSRLHLDLLWLSRRAVALRQQLPEAESRGLCSLRVSETQHLPLWTIRLANDILPAQNLLSRWDEGRRWLPRGGSNESEVQSTEIALELLDSVPWSARIPNRAAHLSLLELASLSSDRWLNDEMLNAGHDWTARRVASEAARERVPLSTAIANVFFLPSFHPYGIPGPWARLIVYVYIQRSIKASSPGDLQTSTSLRIRAETTERATISTCSPGRTHTSTAWAPVLRIPET